MHMRIFYNTDHFLYLFAVPPKLVTIPSYSNTSPISGGLLTKHKQATSALLQTSHPQRRSLTKGVKVINDSTHSECAAATQVASAASRPRSLQ